MHQHKPFHKLYFWWRPLLLVTLILITIACGFALAHHTPSNFDSSILLWFRVNGDTGRLIGPRWMTTFWLGMTWLGNTTPRITVAILAILGLWLMERRHSALFILCVLISGISLSSTIKYWVGRPRPALVPYLDHFTSQSFPSGHALNSTLFYLTIAIVTVSHIRNKPVRCLLYATVIILSFTTGISRIALGVHWPSDVLAGWIIALAWLGLWLLLARHYDAKILT